MYCSSSGVAAVASHISRGWVRSHCAAGLAHMSTAQGWVRSRVRGGCGQEVCLLYMFVRVWPRTVQGVVDGRVVRWVAPLWG